MKKTLVAVAAVIAATATPLRAQFHPSTAKAEIDAVLDKTSADLIGLYKDVHQHPEVAFQENRTAGLLAARMRKLGFVVTEHVGKTGIVAVYRNGTGPTILVRTELDALPMEEKTGLPYASKAQQTVDGKLTYVDHACGHDSHMAWWLGTAQALIAMKSQWHGTLLFVGQPAEESGGGARAMLDDGLFTRFPKPDYGFAAHVGPGPSGTVTVKQGVVSSSADTIHITFHGVGAHGSMPDKSIDPIMEGVQFANDVQTVISRRKDPLQFGVITIGSFNAGTVANIIPDHADLQLTLRSFDPAIRKLLVEGLETAARSVAEMAHAPAPDVKHMGGTSSVFNDQDLAARTAGMLKTALGEQHVALVAAEKPGTTASEDYSEFVAAGMPKSVFFAIGGYDPATIARYNSEGKPLPVNHSPYFAPDPATAIPTGVRTLTLAVLMVAGSAK